MRIKDNRFFFSKFVVNAQTTSSTLMPIQPNPSTTSPYQTTQSNAKNAINSPSTVFFVRRSMIYFPQLEQEQSEPQLQLEVPEHPHSPFILMVVVWVFVGEVGRWIDNIE